MLAPFSSCAKLRTLDFMDSVEVEVNWPGNTSSRKCCADAVVQLSNLKQLAINVTTSDAQDFLRWLSLPNVSMPHLKQIELSFHKAEDIEYMFELLSDPLFTIWTRIDKVTLDLQDSRTGTNFNLRGLPSAFYLPLGQFAHLELFTNRTQVHGIIDAIAWWGYSLRGHTSLQTLSLSFRSVPARTSKQLRAAFMEAWGRLDIMLSQDTLASLKEVRFVDEKRRLITRDANPDLVRSIREAMPRLSSKGVLLFI